jgi:hypothetical protein
VRRRRFPPPKFNGKTLPDFVQALFKRIKSGVNGLVMEAKNIAARESPENPAVTLRANKHLQRSMSVSAGKVFSIMSLRRRLIAVAGERAERATVGRDRHQTALLRAARHHPRAGLT